VHAVLFDVDGTILDANHSIREAMNRVLFEEGQPTFKKAELDDLIGHPLREILGRKCKDAAAVERMAHRYRAVYNESAWVLSQLYPGIRELLEDLAARGVPLGIVTSKGQREAELLLGDLGISSLFGAVVGDDDKRPLKPDPAPVQEAARRLGVQSAILVGDTRFDVESAKAAGAGAIGVLWGNGSREELLEAGADHLAVDVAQLRRLLA
jgi:phosphoglycolate phosphatase